MLITSLIIPRTILKKSKISSFEIFVSDFRLRKSPLPSRSRPPSRSPIPPRHFTSGSGSGTTFLAGCRHKVVAEKLLLGLFLIGWTFFPTQIRPQKRSSVLKCIYRNYIEMRSKVTVGITASCAFGPDARESPHTQIMPQKRWFHQK